MRFGIALKINLIVLLVVLSLGVTVGAVFITEQQKTLHEALDRRVQLIGGGLSKSIESAAARNDIESIDRILQSFTLDPELSYIMVKSVDGEILAAHWARSTTGDVHEHSFPLHTIPMRGGSAEHAQLFGVAEDSSKGSVIGNLTIGVNLSLVHSATNGLIRRTVILALLGSAFALLIGVSFVRLILKRSIDPLLGKIREIGAGDLSSRVNSISNDEIGDIGTAFNGMADQLARTLVSKQELEEIVMQRTADLNMSHEEINKISLQLVWAEERERERIAGELHDHVGQSLLLAKMKLDALANEIPSDSLRFSAEETSSLLATSIHDVRTLTVRMRPPILETAGIETALEWLCSSIRDDYPLQIDFINDCQPKPLPAGVRYSLYQAVRELLLNVTKHAGTEKAQLSLKSDNHALVVQVTDNGVGFNHPDVHLKHLNGGYGLYSVQQRIEHISGRFAVDSAPGRGTTVTLMVPLHEN